MADVDIRQEVDISKLRWPEDCECEDESTLGMNRSYMDLRGFQFSEVSKLIKSEQKYRSRIDAGEDYDDLQEELFEDFGEIYYQGFFGLDPGVASSVAALSAFGCVPFTSCNGGEFGGRHYETMPLVAFFALPKHVAPLLEAAKDCRVGLVNDVAGAGAIVLFAAWTKDLQGFAAHLSEKYG